jgi:hypothetical protein
MNTFHLKVYIAKRLNYLIVAYKCLNLYYEILYK